MNGTAQAALRKMDNMSKGIKVIGAVVALLIVSLFTTAALSVIFVSHNTGQRLTKQQQANAALTRANAELTRSVLQVVAAAKEQTEANGQAVELLKECVRPSPPGKPPTQCARDTEARMDAALAELQRALDAPGMRAALTRIEARLEALERARPPATTPHTHPPHEHPPASATPPPVAPAPVCLGQPGLKCS